MKEHRAEIRMLCADMVQVCWRDGAGSPHRCTALLEDISPSGACLQFENGIPPGARLHLICNGERLEGVVRYCNYREFGYFVGVAFAPGRPWSQARFKPRHLLDLRRLVQ